MILVSGFQFLNSIIRSCCAHDNLRNLMPSLWMSGAKCIKPTTVAGMLCVDNKIIKLKLTHEKNRLFINGRNYQTTFCVSLINAINIMAQLLLIVYRFIQVISSDTSSSSSFSLDSILLKGLLHSSHPAHAQRMVHATWHPVHPQSLPL